MKQFIVHSAQQGLFTHQISARHLSRLLWQPWKIVIFRWFSHVCSYRLVTISRMAMKVVPMERAVHWHSLPVWWKVAYLQRFSRYWPLKIFCRVIFAKNHGFRSPERPEKCIRLRKCIYQVARVAAWTYQQQKADWPTRCYGNQAKMADFWPKITEKWQFRPQHQTHWR